MKSNNNNTDHLVIKAAESDLDTICRLFEEAIEFQKMNNYTGWNNYDRAYLLADIQNGLLFKIINQNGIICIFSICYHDELIWRDMEKGDALYLHRIVLNRQFKGEKIFKKVLNWAVSHALEKQLSYIRMDTWASNEKIINYYRSYGFMFIENYKTGNTESLPIQHRNLDVALLQLKMDSLTKESHLAAEKNMPVPGSELQKINIYHELAAINKYWSQQIIGQVNGQLIKLAKGTGEINWHKHDDQDELFILYKGHLTIQLRNRNIELYPHEMFIVPKGTEHCPLSHGESEFLIMGLNITSNAAGGRPGHFS